MSPPKVDITTKMLLCHTAGFGHAVFNENCAKLSNPPYITAEKEAILTPLLFEPGSRWEYGFSTDWAGLIVEAISGLRLEDYFKKHIFKSLRMTETTFLRTEEMLQRQAALHLRNEDNSLSVLPDFQPLIPEVYMGGGGLHSTALDFAKLIRMWLNDGAAPDGSKVLKPETVKLAMEVHLNGVDINDPLYFDPKVSKTNSILPHSSKKGWEYSFFINGDPLPTGVPSGSCSWFGIAHVFYWIDKKTGIGGFWATQVLPYGDVASTSGFNEFQKTVYTEL